MGVVWQCWWLWHHKTRPQPWTIVVNNLQASARESAPSGCCSWRRLRPSSYQGFICSGLRSSFFKFYRSSIEFKWAPAKLIHDSMHSPTLTRTQIQTRHSRRSAWLMPCFAQMRRSLREQTLLRVGFVHGYGLFKWGHSHEQRKTKKSVTDFLIGQKTTQFA